MENIEIKLERAAKELFGEKDYGFKLEYDDIFNEVNLIKQTLGKQIVIWAEPVNYFLNEEIGGSIRYALMIANELLNKNFEKIATERFNSELEKQ